METYLAKQLKDNSKPDSPVRKIDHFYLFYELGKLIKKAVKDGTTVPFSEDQIKEVLRKRQISDKDMTEAIQYCQDAGLLEKRETGAFHVTSNGLANYNAMLRRI